LFKPPLFGRGIVDGHCDLVPRLMALDTDVGLT